MKATATQSIRWLPWVLTLGMVCGCSQWLATRRCQSVLRLAESAEQSFRQGKDPEAKALYQKALDLASKVETSSRQKPIQEKAKDVAETCRRHLAMYGTPSEAAATIMDGLGKNLDEFEQYVDVTTFAKEVIIRDGKPSTTPADLDQLHQLFAAFYMTLMSSGNPFEVATCEIQEGQIQGQKALCHVVCSFAGVETTVTLSLSKSQGGRWQLRDFLIPGLGVSCIGAFKNALLAVEKDMSFDEICRRDRETLQKIEREYHNLTEKPDSLIYESSQGRLVRLKEITQILDEKGGALREGTPGETFWVVKEVLKDQDVMWLEVRLEGHTETGPTGWLTKSSIVLVPREEEDVWGL